MFAVVQYVDEDLDFAVRILVVHETESLAYDYLLRQDGADHLAVKTYSEAIAEIQETIITALMSIEDNLYHKDANYNLVTASLNAATKLLSPVAFAYD